jgi:hypothetical protein
MSTPRPTRYEVVHTDAGWHARRRYAGNLQIAWQTEVLTRMSRALHTIETEPGVIRLQRGGPTVGSLCAVLFTASDDGTPQFDAVEVRYVDERARSQQPTLTARRQR